MEKPKDLQREKVDKEALKKSIEEKNKAIKDNKIVRK